MRKLKVYIGLFLLRVTSFCNRRAWIILRANATVMEQAFICYSELRRAGISVESITKNIETSVSEARDLPPTTLSN